MLASAMFETVMQFYMRFFSEHFMHTSLTVESNFSELAEVFRWNKRTCYKVKLVEICNPFRVYFVVFLPFDRFNIFRMGKTDIDISFEIIENWNPIFAVRFHTDVLSDTIKQPVMKIGEITIDDSK